MKVEEFYNNISKEYTGLLERTIPKYGEMLLSILLYIPDGLEPLNILELGCGTGNLTELLCRRYPKSGITAVDISGEILNECKARLNSCDSIKFIQSDFKEMTFEKDTFDLVVSSIAIHHLEDDQKKVLFEKVSSYLKSGGVFIFADQCRGETDEIYRKNIDKWREEAFRLGATEADWKTWMEHQEKHDFHSTAGEQIKWLKSAFFDKVDILWRNLLWAVVYAEK